MSAQRARGEGQQGDGDGAMLWDCRSIGPCLHRYVEGELDPVRSRLVEEHIALCPVCCEKKERLDLERLWLVEATFRGPALSTRLVDKVMEPIRRRAERSAALRRWRRFGAACAAAVFIVLILGYSQGSWWSTASGPDDTIAGAELNRGTPDQVARAGLQDARLHDARLLIPETIRVVVDEVFPAERGGFRVGQTNPTFVDFGPPSVSLLPEATREREWSCYHAAPEIAASGPRTRIYRVVVRRTLSLRFHDTVGIALRLKSARAVDHPAGPLDDADPCLPDPNADGKVDSGDIAYTLGVLYGAQLPYADEGDAENAAVDPDCDPLCLGA